MNNIYDVIRKHFSFPVAGKALLGMTCALFAFTSCENGDVSFGDYDYQTVYFANQTFVRTITLGEDVYSTDLDNEHKFQIYATLGGVESNSKDRKVQIAVDNSLVTGLKFANILDADGTSTFENTGNAIEAMPTDYYTLSSNTITISSGQVMGCVDVQLTDAFFADPKALYANYVIPVRMTSATDSILSGTAKDGVSNPDITNSDDWDVAPKNYVLYAVKFKNKWHGAWLSHGTDVIDLNGVTSTETREPENVEDYDVRYISSLGLKQCSYPVTTTVSVNGAVKTLTCNLILSFDDDDNCTITTDSEGCTASGSGKWTYHGAGKAWGNNERDLLALSYTITYSYNDGEKECYKKYTSTDNLISLDRQNKFQTFSYTNE